MVFLHPIFERPNLVGRVLPGVGRWNIRRIDVYRILLEGLSRSLTGNECSTYSACRFKLARISRRAPSPPAIAPGHALARLVPPSPPIRKWCTAPKTQPATPILASCTHVFSLFPSPFLFLS